MAQICRVCLEEGEDFVSLGSGAGSHRHKLTTCVPEIEIDILKDPTLCNACLRMLDTAYKLKQKCLESEKKLVDNVSIITAKRKPLLCKRIVGDLNRERLAGKKRKRKEYVENLVMNNVNESDDLFADTVIKQEVDEVFDNSDMIIGDEGSVSHPIGELNEKLLLDALHKINNQFMPDVAIKQEHDYDPDNFDVPLLKEEPILISNDCLTTWIKQEHDYTSTDNIGYYTVESECNADVSNKQASGFLYWCRQCEKSFTDESSLIDHTKTHESSNDVVVIDDDVKCETCCQFFDSNFIVDHIKIHNAVSTISSKAGENAKVEELVAQQRKETLGDDVKIEVYDPEINAETACDPKLICTICGELFTDLVVLQSHINGHAVPVECTVCTEMCDKSSIKAHMDYHNVVEEIVIDSDADEAAFVNFEENYKAVRGVSANKPVYKCCDMVYSSLYLLHMHTTKVHGYVCYICNLKFANKQALGGHFRIHNDGKIHRCGDCGKKFTQRGNLLRHTNAVHRSEMPYKCDKCGERFKRNKYLEEHIRAHSQNYVCNECNMVFKELRVLRRHKRTHAPRPLECELCNTLFARKSSLVRHRKDIHKLATQGKRCYGFGDIVLGQS